MEHRETFIYTISNIDVIRCNTGSFGNLEMSLLFSFFFFFITFMGIRLWTDYKRQKKIELITNIIQQEIQEIKLETKENKETLEAHFIEEETRHNVVWKELNRQKHRDENNMRSELLQQVDFDITISENHRLFYSFIERSATDITEKYNSFKKLIYSKGKDIFFATLQDNKEKVAIIGDTGICIKPFFEEALLSKLLSIANEEFDQCRLAILIDVNEELRLMDKDIEDEKDIIISTMKTTIKKYFKSAMKTSIKEFDKYLLEQVKIEERKRRIERKKKEEEKNNSIKLTDTELGKTLTTIINECNDDNIKRIAENLLAQYNTIYINYLTRLITYQEFGIECSQIRNSISLLMNNK